MEHSLLQTWTGYSKELTTGCKLFGVNLKSVEAHARRAFDEAGKPERTAERKEGTTEEP